MSTLYSKEKRYRVLTPFIFVRRCAGFFFHPKSSIRYFKQYRLVSSFGEFDAEYYISQVNQNKVHRLNALSHYILYGRDMGYLPESGLMGDYYQELEKIRQACNAIKRSGQFDVSFYKEYENTPEKKTEAIIHYIKYGWKVGYKPNRSFDTQYYLESNPDVEEDGINPFIHYLQYGIYEERPACEKHLDEGRYNTKFKLVIQHLRMHGLKKTVIRILFHHKKDKKYKYRQWVNLYGISKNEYAIQKNHIFPYNPLISILVPAYNTKAEFIEDLLNSVKLQSYSNWELCVADGSNTSTVESYIKSNLNDRIKYKKLMSNKGITGNTLDAYSMATGDYIVFLDHDDFLAPEALFEVVRSINCNPGTDFIFSDRAVVNEKKNRILGFHFLPGFSPELLRCYNYASHLNAFSKKIINEVGFERIGFEGAQDYDLELRVIEKTDKVVHIPRVLYYCRAHKDSVSGRGNSKPYAYESGLKVLEEHTSRIGYPAKVTYLPATHSYKLDYEIQGNPSVAVIIPNKDYSDGLRRCINSVLEKSTYDNFNIYIIENNSEEGDTFRTYDELEKHAKVSILKYPDKGFNYSGIHNWTVGQLNEDYILLLNNDTEVITENWIEEMLMYAQRDDVGAVGCMLYYPDDRIQHCGLEIGLNGWIASHQEHRKQRGSHGYMNRLRHVQNYTGLTAACLMVCREDYLSVGGMDQVNLKVSLNDMDLCLKLIDFGKLNVFTPYAELYHYEGVTRGYDLQKKNRDRFQKESEFFKDKWSEYYKKPDRYSNPNTGKYIY